MFYLLTLTLFDDSIGQFLGKNGDRYEGEWKDGNRHGQGKKQVNTFYDLLILTLFDDSIGKQFGNNGDRYEGEWKDGKRHSQCKKEVIYFLLY